MDPIFGQFAFVSLTYDAQHRDREDLKKDVGFYSRLAAEAAGRVLEVGCGTGRVLLPIRRSGIDVWGVDISEGMLEALKAKARRAGLECKLHQGDVRDFTLTRKFRLIMLPFRVFQHMLTPADQLRALENCRNHLLPGGRLALNLFNPDLRRMLDRTGQPVYEGSFSHPVTQRTVHRWAAGRADWERQVVENEVIFQECDDTGKLVDTHILPLRMRWTTRWEFEHLAARAGLAVEALYGDFDHGPFTASSQEQVWVLKK